MLNENITSNTTTTVTYLADDIVIGYATRWSADGEKWFVSLNHSKAACVCETLVSARQFIINASKSAARGILMGLADD